jgi:hypothetical protein
MVPACNEWLFEPSLAKLFHKECYKRSQLCSDKPSAEEANAWRGILSTRRDFGQYTPDDPSTDEDVRKVQYLFLCFMVQFKVVTGRS